jgi:hypothetical protein
MADVSLPADRLELVKDIAIYGGDIGSSSPGRCRRVCARVAALGAKGHEPFIC